MLKLIVSLLSYSALASVPSQFLQNNISYSNSFGSCPTKSASEFSIQVMREFEKEKSLKDVKSRLLKEKWEEKYFISYYKVSFSPVESKLRLVMDCPKALLKLQIYRPDGKEHYSAILANNGKLYDPSYEILLRTENKLERPVPYLAMPVNLLETATHETITHISTTMPKLVQNWLSEVIVNDEKELIMIFSAPGKSTTVFLGKDLWEEKILRLNKIFSYMDKSRHYPSTINLTNAKKVVVKFGNTL